MMKIKGTTEGSGASPRARWRGYGVLCGVVLLSLIIAGCAPTLKRVEVSDELIKAEREKQQELAFSMLMKRWDRLLNVSYPLRAAAADFCENAAKPTYGFALHDKVLYEEMFGKDYVEVAARHFGLGKPVMVRYVHPELPAGEAGLRVGDTILTIGDKSCVSKDDKNAEETDKTEEGCSESSSPFCPEDESTRKVGGYHGKSSALKAMKFLSSLDLPEDKPLLLKIEREGEVIELALIGLSACNYSVLIANDDRVNAFADGKRVIITTGMVRFTETDNELVLVIGHEIAHNALGHMNKKAGNVFLGSLLDILLAATVGVNTQGLFGQIGGMAFSQSFEAEADYAGLYIAARAGFDIKDAANFWRRMAVEHPGSIRHNFTSTHPSTAERFVTLEKAVKEIEEKKQKGEPLEPEKKSPAKQEKKSKVQEDE